MEDTRYIVTAVMVIAYPPGFAYWLLLHPFAGYWRRMGAGPAAGFLVATITSLALVLAAARDGLIVGDLGTRPALMVAGIALFAVAAVIEVACRRHLTLSIFAGVPELRGRSGTLLTRGVYSVVRHPRYVGGAVGTLGLALYANYLSAYVLCALYFPLIAAIAGMEERELLARYGDEYRDYMQRVPRFVPRRRR